MATYCKDNIVPLIMSSVLSLCVWGSGYAKAVTSDAFEPYPTKSIEKLKKRKKAVRKIYEGITFGAALLDGIKNEDPASIRYVNSIFQKDLPWEPGKTVLGRVVPAGTYEGQVGAEEYFWGLGDNDFNKATSINVTSLIASADKVAVEVDINFCRRPFLTEDKNGCRNPVTQEILTTPYKYQTFVDPSTGATVTLGYTLRQTGFYTFNRDDKVISYDANILNLGAVPTGKTPPAAICAYQIVSDENMPITMLGGASAKQLGLPVSGKCINFWNRDSQYPKTPEGIKAAGQVLHYEYSAMLPGDKNGVQNAMANCMEYMKKIPEGNGWRMNSNTQTCRRIHMLLINNRMMHCGHAGPKGFHVEETDETEMEDGKEFPKFQVHYDMPKCGDFSYESFWDKEY